MGRKIIFCSLFLFILLPLVFAYTYSEGNYSNSFYGTGYYVAPEGNTDNEVSEETTTTISEGGYAPQTYYIDEKIQTQGNNFDLRYKDKIHFIVNFTNHTLTMQNFNSTIAKVLIQSNPINIWLEKGILYEFDVNNDSTKDVKVKYGGLNGTKAMMFIQKIVYSSDEPGITGDAVNNSPETKSKLKSIKDNKYLILGIITIFTIGIVLFFILHKHHRKRRYWMYGY